MIIGSPISHVAAAILLTWPRKAQYETRLRKWGFRKYVKGTQPRDWQIISRKFASAKAKVTKTGKEPRLYYAGKLVSAKVLKTRSFMTFLEQKALEEGTVLVPQCPY